MRMFIVQPTLSEITAHSPVYLHLIKHWAAFIQLNCCLRRWSTVQWAITSEREGWVRSKLNTFSSKIQNCHSRSFQIFESIDFKLDSVSVYKLVLTPTFIIGIYFSLCQKLKKISWQGNCSWTHSQQFSIDAQIISLQKSNRKPVSFPKEVFRFSCNIIIQQLARARLPGTLCDILCSLSTAQASEAGR